MPKLLTEKQGVFFFWCVCVGGGGAKTFSRGQTKQTFKKKKNKQNPL
jgi:hypothetical protein